MKKRLLPLVFLFSIFGYSQITIDESLTTQELIEDVLLTSSSCAQVSDFGQRTGTDFGDGNGIGAFSANGSGFPFESGIILSSGFVSNAPGPNLTLHSDGGFGWPGSTILEANTTATDTNNASMIQFNFVPLINQISFNFIFASEEYNQNFECTYSDAFAFVLTDQATGVVQNLAVLPGTNIPIEATNVHPDVPGGCPAINEEYFDKYNFLPFNDQNLAPIDYNGQIIILTAMGPVIPGNLYTIQLVIADEQDTALDSAVFLEAGSFDLGDVDLGLDLTIADGTAICEGDTFTIEPEIDGPDGTSFEWFFEDPLGSGIFSPFAPPETGPILEITQTGRYKLIIDFNGQCTTEGEIFIEYTVPPVPLNPDPLVVCDSDNDGVALFTLTDADDTITGGDPTLIVTYHETLLNAENEILPLSSPHQNNIAFIDHVFARVETGTSDCFAVVELELQVRNSPLIIDPEPLRLCDYNNPGDGFEIFDLTEVELEVLNGLDPAFWDFYYYVDNIDAVTAGDLALTLPDFSLAIASPTTYINSIPNQQDVFILVVGNASNIDPNNGGLGCYNIVTLPLYVDPLPAAFEPTDRYELCDDEVENVSTGTDQTSAFDLTSYDDLITQGDTTLFVTWYETLADEIADNPIVEPTAYRNTVLNEQTVVARVTNAFSCHITVLLTLRVNPNPTPVTPTPLEVCDDDNDGFADFTLNDKDDEIIGGEPDVTIEYYENEILAREGDAANILPTPYTNDYPFIDTVWARIDNGTTGCFAVIELTLIVDQLPDMPTVEFDDLIACDDDGTGTAIFDLTENIPFIIGIQDASDFLPITFYTSLADAEVPTNPILNPTIFTSTGQTIWVRIENATTGCLRILSFDLIVEALPLIDAGPFSHHLCDDLLNGSTGTDGISTFNLAENNDLITIGNVTLSVFYYETEADQDAGNFIDPDTAYQNVTTPQTLYVSVFSQEACEVRTLLTLQVDNNPSPVTPLPLQGCDDDDDGITTFILTDKDDEITGGEANVDISYYETQEQAIIGDPADALVSPYTNTVAFSQIIWVRDQYTFGLNCYTVISLKLQVNPLPDDSVEVSDEIDCQVPFVGTNSIILDSKNPEILNGQDPLIFDVLYFVTQADADAMNNPIASTIPYFYDTTGITIYVVILNTETGCYVVTQSFLLIVQEGVIAITPSLPYAICDYDGDNDGEATFDLVDFSANINGIDIREEILGGQDPNIFTLHFYKTLEAAELGDFLNADLSPSYTNIINPEIIYARVTNINNTGDYEDKCHEIVEVILKVEELPIINIDDEYRLCVDGQNNPIEEEEGEMSPPVIDTGLDPAVYSFVWDLGGTVLLGELGASITALQGGTYTVTVTEIATGCENSESTTVTVSSPPLVYSAEVVSGAFAINEVIHTDTSGVETTFTGTHVIHVTATGEGEYIFQLDEGVFQEGDVFVDVQPGVHIVTIKDKFGCGSVEITLSVVDYPRFITPNQDGFHDTWNIIGIAGLDPTAKIYIFDRYGKLLKQISPLGPGWDGTYNGNTLPSSDYWFRVEYLEDNTRKEIKGHFTLKR